MAGSRLPRLRRSPAPKFGILCYHRVGIGGVPLFSQLDPQVFEAQMRHLRKRYRLVSLAQMCRELQDSGPGEPALAITFDDGYRDLYTHAFPVLQKYKIPATVYLIGRCVETGETPWYDRIFVAFQAVPGAALELELDGPRRFELSNPAARARAAWEIVCYLRAIPDARRRACCAALERQIPPPREELKERMLNWEQVRRMHDGGVFFGAHTLTHPVVSQLEPGAWEEELASSKQLLESRLGSPVEDFAYPFGKPEHCGLAAEDFLRRCGYRSAVTTAEGCNTKGVSLYRLRRLQIGDSRSISSFAFNVGRLFLEVPSESPVDSAAAATRQARREELRGMER